MADLDETHLAQLTAALSPAPAAWVAAAQQLPAAREALDTLFARARASMQERAIIIKDLEAALAAEGVEPLPAVVDELHARLERFST